MNDLWRLWAAFLVLLMVGISVRADDPFKVTKPWVDPFKPVPAPKTPAKKATCPANCGCDGDCADGACGCGPCSAKRPSAPKNDYKHDCGCGSLPCNCTNGCHCAGHRAENRLLAKWIKADGVWKWVRGSRILGAVNTDGVYYPYDDEAEKWLAPTKLPAPLPVKQEQTMRVQSAPVCRT